MSKLSNSIEKKLRRWAFNSPWLNKSCVWLDKRKSLNIPLLCKIYPNNIDLKNKLVTAQSTLNSLFSDIRVRDDNDIPKKIWIYWAQGYDSAPDIVKVAYHYWQTMNPDYDVCFLDEKKIQSYFDFQSLFYNFSLDAGAAHKSDFIRVYLLSRYGGVWVDSTTFCWKPLDSWLQYETKGCGLFLFKQTQDRPDRQIKNWFMASAKGNPVMVSLLHALAAYNFKPRQQTLSITRFKEYQDCPGISHEGTGLELLNALEEQGRFPYFYFHYLFNEVVKSGDALACWSIAKHTRNEHTNAGSEIGDALVSKQNYKTKYRQSDEYRERVALLEKITASQRDG
ncbi:capsular polysaccharide synthesis protein [Vibrio nitrifigilis]|uniref:Capsular polysaccharide synthesis protein n=1 Tax=Vibrio nitrifigilis TaxID=2789781 RepID=A0ABS0GM04_9VIBR|nr:capsular polysaccharide synthesis protein [Vibrio nitrifigilis]MBF9003463.1 hypothetical protein [Vibrio nitrifigilis]